jgi:GLPGLI family protein
MHFIRYLSLITLFFLFKPCFSQNHTGRATYGIITNINFDEIKDLKNGEVEILRKAIDDSNNTSEIKFELTFNTSKSLFYALPRLSSDSDKVNMASIKAKITGIIFTDINEGLIIQQKEKFGETFKITKRIESYQWELTKEQKKIGNYNCFKAILMDSTKVNKITEAWYTNEIAANYGPMGFCGLPGLIVLLKEDIFYYILEGIKFNEKNEKKITEPKKGREVTTKEYDSIYHVMLERKEKLERENEGY